MIVRTNRRFTVEEYEQMAAHGILNENDRVELIHGEIVEKMVIGDEHAACVKRLIDLLSQHTGKQALLSVQDPVRLADSVPQPDVALLTRRADFYVSGKPRPADVLLLIEVADTSLEYDRTVKGPLYASSGITEYWIVNINDHCIETHRGPRPDGTFQEVATVRPGETLTIAALPGCTLRAEEILG